MKTIDKIITKVGLVGGGAPMGRKNVGTLPMWTNIYDCEVPLNKGGYDRGGAYWGKGAPLRVQYTGDLSYIRFYRETLIKDWYVKEYPDDDYGKHHISSKATFEGLNRIIDTEENIYFYLMVGQHFDSLIRERIFAKLAELLNVPYDNVYQRWLNSATELT